MVITKAPLRVSFLGGGTDYPEYFLQEGGAVLGCAIDKFACITANRFSSELFDYTIRLAYRNVELAADLEEVRHTPFRETLRHCGVRRDIELNYIADLPAFTGLGSSSSFTVALLQALHAHCGRYRSGLELAYEAIYLERHVFGDRVGCQDQVLAAVGGFNLLEFRAEDDILVHRLAIAPARLRELQENVLVFFTGIRRSASAVAARQIARVAANRPALRDMRALVDVGARIMTSAAPLSAFGELLHRSWMMKRSLDDQVTNPGIDGIYQTARDAGALGGKLLGAGAGGFVLLVVPPERQAAVRRALAGLTEVQLRFGARECQIVHQERDSYQRPDRPACPAGDGYPVPSGADPVPVGAEHAR